MKPLNLMALGFVIPLALATGTARADWTPPAVVTLDAFAATGGKGANPTGPLAVAPDGNLYGSTYSGGTNGTGTLFRLTTAGAFTNLYDFGPDVEIRGPLMVGPNGALYCKGELGGYSGEDGFQYEPALFILATNGTVGFEIFALPEAPGLGAVVLGPDGALYVTYQGGGLYPGAVFRVAPDGTTTNLHYFDYPGFGTNGSGPDVLLAGPDGALYGSTYSGGTSNESTIYRLTTEGDFTKLHDFNGPDGIGPGSLLVGSDGALYGSTSLGGDGNNGTLFRLTTGGTFTKLHDFDGTDGSTAGLLAGPDGALYGSTGYGGTSNQGTLFRLETNGAFTKLHDFNGTDGSAPDAAMVVGPDGALYGSTYSGGTSNQGTLFRLTTGGLFTKLYDFNGTNGQNPQTPLVVGPDGALYGSTADGGPQGGGILFKLVLQGPPMLSIAQSNASVIVSWPVTSLNLQLQETTDLSLPNSWSPATQPAVTNAGQISVTVSTIIGSKFFRLKSQ